MTVNVHLFARARELAGAAEVGVEIPGVPSVGHLRLRLAIDHPALADLLKVCAIAVNHDFADDARVIGPADEIAVIPPVSGG